MKINHLDYFALAQYNLVYGHRIDDACLKKQLSNIGCQKAMALVSRFTSLHIALTSHDSKAEALYFMLRSVHSVHIEKLGGNISTYMQFRAIMCPQSLFLLNKWILTSCPIEEQISPVQMQDLQIIMDALLAINDKLPEDIGGMESEYLYLTLYHNTFKSIKNQIARAYYIYSVLAKAEIETSEFLRKYEEIHGFSVEERLSILFASISNIIPQSDSNLSQDIIKEYLLKNLYITNNFDAKNLSKIYKKVMATLSEDYSTMIKSISSKIDRVWDFEPFYRNPFICFDNVMLPVSMVAIVYQLWEGLYWNVRYSFSNSKDGKKFMRGFGRPFERYIQEITRRATENSVEQIYFQNEFPYHEKKQEIRSTDCYFRIGKTLFAVEAKAKSPHADTLTGVCEQKIMEEIDDIVVSPIIQVCDRLREIYSPGTDVGLDHKEIFKDVENIIILVVSMEKVQPVGKYLSIADAKVKETIKGLNVQSYFNINIEEYEVICSLIEKYPNELSQMLQEWFDDQRIDFKSAVVLSTFLLDKNIQYNCSEYISSLFETAIKEISIKIWGKELSVKNINDNSTF